MISAIRNLVLSVSLIGCVNSHPIVSPQPPELINEPVVITEEVTEPVDEWVSLGEMTLTAYCSCVKCCGKYANGYTAVGTKATEGRTIGVNPKIIPYGTEVMIGDHIYVAEDTGGSSKQKHIDVYYDTHERALAQGVLRKGVFVRNANRTY